MSKKSKKREQQEEELLLSSSKPGMLTDSEPFSADTSQSSGVSSTVGAIASRISAVFDQHLYTLQTQSYELSQELAREQVAQRAEAAAERAGEREASETAQKNASVYESGRTGEDTSYRIASGIESQRGERSGQAQTTEHSVSSGDSFSAGPGGGFGSGLFEVNNTSERTTSSLSDFGTSRGYPGSEAAPLQSYFSNMTPGEETRAVARDITLNLPDGQSIVTSYSQSDTLRSDVGQTQSLDRVSQSVIAGDQVVAAESRQLSAVRDAEGQVVSQGEATSIQRGDQVHTQGFSSSQVEASQFEALSKADGEGNSTSVAQSEAVANESIQSNVGAAARSDVSNFESAMAGMVQSQEAGGASATLNGKEGIPEQGLGASLGLLQNQGFSEGSSVGISGSVLGASPNQGFSEGSSVGISNASQGVGGSDVSFGVSGAGISDGFEQDAAQSFGSNFSVTDKLLEVEQGINNLSDLAKSESAPLSLSNAIGVMNTVAQPAADLANHDRQGEPLAAQIGETVVGALPDINGLKEANDHVSVATLKGWRGDAEGAAQSLESAQAALAGTAYEGSSYEQSIGGLKEALLQGDTEKVSEALTNLRESEQGLSKVLVSEAALQLNDSEFKQARVEVLMDAFSREQNEQTFEAGGSSMRMNAEQFAAEMGGSGSWPNAGAAGALSEQAAYAEQRASDLGALQDLVTVGVLDAKTGEIVAPTEGITISDSVESLRQELAVQAGADGFSAQVAQSLESERSIAEQLYMASAKGDSWEDIARKVENGEMDPQAAARVLGSDAQSFSKTFGEAQKDMEEVQEAFRSSSEQLDRTENVQEQLREIQEAGGAREESHALESITEDSRDKAQQRQLSEEQKLEAEQSAEMDMGGD